MWSWRADGRAGGGLGKAGGLVGREQTKLEGWGGFGKAQVDTAEYAGLDGVEGEAPGLGRAGWHPNLNLECNQKEGWRGGGPEFWPLAGACTM